MPRGPIKKDYDIPDRGRVRVWQISRAMGICDGTLWNRIKEGRFPKGHKDGRMTFWYVEEVLPYIKKENQEKTDSPPIYDKDTEGQVFQKEAVASGAQDLRKALMERLPEPQKINGEDYWSVDQIIPYLQEFRA